MMSRAGLAGLACLSLAATASRAADWDGSYAADGRCYCSGTFDSALSSRIVPTPLGGQSVATVCGRIGKGPGLSLVDGRFDRVVYADAQCGHGPGAGGERIVETDCSGTMEPGGDDCHATGPRWDLASAYARTTRRAVEASVAQIGASVMGAPAAVPVMGAAAPAQLETPPDANIVEIDGRRWREAPAGTPERGAPGTRIVLDGKVYLDVELASEADFLPRPGQGAKSRKGAPKAPPAAAARPTTAPAPAPRAAAASPAPSAESLQERRERLLAEARERLREREARERADAAATSARTTTPPANAEREPAGTPSATASTADAMTDGAPPIGAALERAPESASDDPAEVPSTIAPAPTDETIASDERSSRDADELAGTDADAVAESAGTLAEGEDGETLSPFMQALRMPAETRPSSREFGYVDAMPASWDYGGGGLMLEGSAALKGRFRALARMGAATDYQELLVGGSWYTTPARADRMTFVLTAGVETGRFELDGVRGGRRVGTELSDTGLYLGAASRFVVNRRFELQAGVGYSSFFDGDPTLFGGSYFHIGRQLDVVSRVEVGDNDSLGIGVRYYY